ncbi:Short chain dehydrogenase/reductase dpfgH [Cladobotryum mycophilum]|uniref:Short chain dehydrogenase/reductase dpfgH n=1 Tax=Cladobotryum mycophilum TaxID=491253 RepID=A0ABR0SPT8_9HYPO
MPWDEGSIPDLTSKVSLVTGANAGIGFETARQLALHGAKVYLGARSQTRANQAISKILAQHASISVERLVWLSMDLSDLSSVVTAAQKFSSVEPRLDILINNAGIAADDFVTTKEGVELTMAVNYVGHFALTTKLLPLLKATAAQPESDVRVVTLSSVAEKFAPSENMFTAPGDLRDPCAEPGAEASHKARFRRYGLTKLAGILFTRELQKRMNDQDIKISVLCTDPGPVATEGGLGVWPWYVRPVMRLVANTAEKGAKSSLFCATAEEIVKERERYGGELLGGLGKVLQGTERSRDMRLAKSLWQTTETLLTATGI